MFQKKPVNAFYRQSEEYKYQELLTPYALTYVLKQMSTRVDVELKEEENEEHEQQWYICWINGGKSLGKLLLLHMHILQKYATTM